MSDRDKLAVVAKNDVKSSLKDIQQEIAGEHLEMVRDLVKGAYRMRQEFRKNIEDLQSEIDKIDVVLDKVENQGDVEAIKEIKINARFLSEKTARLANLDWLED